MMKRHATIVELKRLNSRSSLLLRKCPLHLLQRLPRWLKIRIDPQRRLKFRHRLR